MEKNFILPANPKAGYLAHKVEIDAAIQAVLMGGWYILGQEVKTFEQEFRDYIGCADMLGVGSGTDALELALRTANVGPGDGVLTVSHTAVATVAAIELTGATPILLDIDPQSYTLSPSSLEAALEHYRASKLRLKAVIPVHLYGAMADMPAILALAKKWELTVIEDCAQAHGAALAARRAGTWGDMATFSFYPTKNLGALGDGGALAINDPDLAQRARLIREYGWRQHYISEVPGMNTRLDELQAAILRVKLSFLEDDNNRRRQIAERYSTGLAGTDLGLPKTPTGCHHVYHQYVVRCKNNRDELQKFMKEHGVGTLVHYPQPVHLQPAYLGRVPLAPGGLPHTELARDQILSLPMHPQLSDADVKSVILNLKNWF
jgi:dTDP-4-amino-4,6-dideoxygalactose transaminase